MLIWISPLSASGTSTRPYNISSLTRKQWHFHLLWVSVSFFLYFCSILTQSTSMRWNRFCTIFSLFCTASVMFKVSVFSHRAHDTAPLHNFNQSCRLQLTYLYDLFVGLCSSFFPGDSFSKAWSYVARHIDSTQRGWRNSARTGTRQTDSRETTQHCHMMVVIAVVCCKRPFRMRYFHKIQK